MARADRSKPRLSAGEALDPDGMTAWMERYIAWMKLKNYSLQSVKGHQSYLTLFIEWCQGRSLFRPQEITKPILESYQRHLFHYRQPRSGKPLSFRAQHLRIMPIKMYFRWLTRQNVLLYNPASELELPKMPKHLPQQVLTAREADQVINQPEVGDVLGLRDRAMLEVLYSTGMRRSELAGLTVYDFDAERGTIMIRQGKGHKDRMVPIGERAIAWVQKYLDEARAELVVEPDEGVLFIGQFGERLTASRLSQIARQYIKAANIGKKGSCHIFRHTAATLMLENGADIRFIQQMLGHAYLSSTQLYTQVSIRQLQKVHALTHPSAKLSPHGYQEHDGTSPSAASSGPSVDGAKLHHLLDREAEQEGES
jgi:integrase/recombinase XerD